MKVNHDIFRSYDIRGRYPDEIDESSAYGIGRAFAEFLIDNGGGKDIVLGRDARLSSEKLMNAFMEGASYEGCSFVDIGLVTTPMLYFATASGGFSGGVMVTASHNPNPYNGFKLVREKATPVGGDTGICWIRDRIASYEEQERGDVNAQEADIKKDYIKEVFELSCVREGELDGLTIALDAGNGTGGEVADMVLKRAGAEVLPLYMEPDGTFPNHIPDPLQIENLQDLISLTKERLPGMAVALDGDADRVVLVTHEGEPVSGDTLTALMGQLLLREKKGKVLYDVRSSNAVPESIRESGGEPVMSKVGHAGIKAKMRNEEVMFGGELSGHYYWGDGLYYEGPLSVILKVAKEIKDTGKSLKELVAPFQRYCYSGEINFQVEDKESIQDTLKQKYSDRGEVTELDGLRVDMQDSWFLVRASNTEPLLRLVAEAPNQEELDSLVSEISALISQG